MHQLFKFELSSEFFFLLAEAMFRLELLLIFFVFHFGDEFGSELDASTSAVLEFEYTCPNGRNNIVSSRRVNKFLHQLLDFVQQVLIVHFIIDRQDSFHDTV